MRPTWCDRHDATDMTRPTWHDWHNVTDMMWLTWRDMTQPTWHDQRDMNDMTWMTWRVLCYSWWHNRYGRQRGDTGGPALAWRQRVASGDEAEGDDNGGTEAVLRWVDDTSADRGRLWEVDPQWRQRLRRSHGDLSTTGAVSGEWGLGQLLTGHLNSGHLTSCQMKTGQLTSGHNKWTVVQWTNKRGGTCPVDNWKKWTLAPYKN